METTSPTVRPATLRMMLASAAEYNWTLRAADISVAFLSATMDFEVMFKMYDQASTLVPDAVSTEGQVAQALKAIYGGRQCSRRFWLKLAQCLKEMGYQVSRGDACLWYRAIGPDGQMIPDYDVSKHGTWDKDKVQGWRRHG